MSKSSKMFYSTCCLKRKNDVGFCIVVVCLFFSPQHLKLIEHLKLTLVKVTTSIDPRVSYFILLFLKLASWKAKGVKAQLPLTRGNRHPHLPMCWKTYPLFVYTCLSAAAAEHKAKGEVNAPKHIQAMCSAHTHARTHDTLHLKV